MRFDEIILNEGRSKPIDQKQAFDLIKTKCSDMFDAHKSNYHIYRGTLSGRANAPLYFEAGDSIRVSANTENTVTLLVDNAGSWANIPKRSKSLICSSNSSVASGYGEVYAVFPFNGSKIAFGIEKDFWYCLPKLGMKVQIFNEMITFFRWKLMHDDKPVDSYNHLVTQLNQLAQICYMLHNQRPYTPIEKGRLVNTQQKSAMFVREIKGEQALLSSHVWATDSIVAELKELQIATIKNTLDAWYSGWFKQMAIYTNNFTSTDLAGNIESLLDPKENGIIVTDTSNIVSHLQSRTNNEIWTEGPAVLLPWTLVKGLK